MISWLALLILFALGLALQRAPAAGRLRDLLWIVNFWAVIPVIVFATFLTFTFDNGLLLAVVASIAASWALLGISVAYARLVARDRDEVGALALGAAFGNTAFIGYPLAQLLYGQPGLSLAVVYDQLCFGIPMTSITPVLARLYGRRPNAPGRPLVRLVLANPPLWGLALGLGLRIAGVDVFFARGLEAVAAAAVGPLGFLMLGLSLPLEALEHEAAEVARAFGSVALRIAGGPLMLFAIALVLGARIPAPFYLIAATPVAFHLLVLARIYDMRPALMRLQVVTSTVMMVAGALIVSRLVAS